MKYIKNGLLFVFVLAVIYISRYSVMALSVDTNLDSNMQYLQGLTVTSDGTEAGDGYVKFSSSGDAIKVLSGNLNMNGKAIKNINWGNSDDGHDSGLDADMLDGLESNDFVTTGSYQNQMSGYVDKGGDTMTGDLNMSGNNIMNVSCIGPGC